MRVWVWVAAAALICGPALAATGDPVPSSSGEQAARAASSNAVTAPDWLRKPTGENMAETYPPDAARKGLQGRAAMKCSVGLDGKLKDCVVLAEAPKNMGFGKAALALSKYFLMTVPSGKEASVTIPITWRLAAGPQAPPSSTSVILDGLPWALVPTRADVIAAFPEGAIGKVDKGQVALRCNVPISTSLTGCEVSTANPAGLGFEEAALSLAKKFEIDLDWRINLDANIRVDIPIQFGIADSQTWTAFNWGKLQWQQTADLEMAQSVFPREAIKAGLSSGSAVVDCTVAQNGSLTDCSPESENPAGLGFGQAVAQVAQHFIMNPWTTTGLPAGGATVRFPMKLVHGPGDPAPTSATKP
jgi:TonB family protein